MQTGCGPCCTAGQGVPLHHQSPTPACRPQAGRSGLHSHTMRMTVIGDTLTLSRADQPAHQQRPLLPQLTPTRSLRTGAAAALALTRHPHPGQARLTAQAYSPCCAAHLKRVQFPFNTAVLSPRCRNGIEGPLRWAAAAAAGRLRGLRPGEPRPAGPPAARLQGARRRGGVRLGARARGQPGFRGRKHRQ